ncbi:MAG: hypothetical protein GY870_06075 [archaeon]|nr:hypothetical protein [archaeon]
MKASELCKYLEESISHTGIDGEVLIEGESVGVNTDDECNIDLYKVAKGMVS